MTYTKEQWEELAVDIIENFEDYSYGFEDEKIVLLNADEHTALIYNCCEDFCKEWASDVESDLVNYNIAYLDANQYEMLGLLKEYCEYLKNENEELLEYKKENIL